MFLGISMINNQNKVKLVQYQKSDRNSFLRQMRNNQSPISD